MTDLKKYPSFIKYENHRPTKEQEELLEVVKMFSSHRCQNFLDLTKQIVDSLAALGFAAWKVPDDTLKEGIGTETPFSSCELFI